MGRYTQIILFLGLSIAVIFGISVLVDKQVKIPKNKSGNLITLSECILKHQKLFHLSSKDTSEISVLAQRAQRELTDIQNKIQEETALIDSRMWESTFETIKFDTLLERKNDLLKEEASRTLKFYRDLKTIISDTGADMQRLQQVCR